MTAIVLVAMLHSDLLPLIQLRTSEIAVEGIAQQGEVLKRMEHDVLGIKSGVEALLTRTDSSGISPTGPTASPPGPEELSRSLKIDEATFFGVDAEHQGAAVESDSHRRPDRRSDHVTRPSVVDSIKAELGRNPTLAVTGYHGCGKTSALAEFADDCGRDECWIRLESSDNTPGKCVARIRLSICEWLGTGVLSEDALRAAMIAKATDAPRLIVIDNAERLGDLRGIEFLLEACEELGGGLWLALGYADDPVFSQSVQLARVRPWRLPGMSTDEAKDLYARMGVENAQQQESIISLIRTQCDGHVGLLRLCRHLVGQQLGEEEMRELLDLKQSSTIGGAISAVVEKLTEALSTESLQLCQAVSLCSHAVDKNLAKHLWTGDDADFVRAWSRCRTLVFEKVEEGRYRLPFLYHTGLHDLVSEDQARRLHLRASEYIRSPRDYTIRLDDAYNCVVHDIQAGDIENAIRDATTFSWIAKHSDRFDVLAFLFEQYDELLTDEHVLASASARMRLHWASFGAVVAGDLNRPDLLRRCTESVRSLLEDEHNKFTESDRQWTTTNLLWCACRLNDVELAWNAWQLLPSRTVQIPGRAGKITLISLVLSLYLSTGTDVSSFCDRLFGWVENHPESASDSWDASDGLQMWRVIGGKLADKIGKPEEVEATEREANVQEFLGSIVKARQLGLNEIACCLEASFVVHLIDVDRNFPLAASRAQAWPIADTKFPNQLRAYLATASGDASRCAGDLPTAQGQYRIAVSQSDVNLAVDYANASIGLAICQFRQQQFPAAVETLRAAKQSLLESSTLFDPQGAAKIRTSLELATLLIHAGEMSDAVQQLWDAHAALLSADDRGVYWVVLAQLATGLAQVVSGQHVAADVAVPGFSFGLPEVIPGSDEMLPIAPSLTMVHALEAVGRTEEAFEIYEANWEYLENADMRWLNDMLVFGYAVRASLLVPCVRTAQRLCSHSPDSSMIPPPGDEDVLLREQVLVNVASVAITHCLQLFPHAEWDQCRVLVGVIDDKDGPYAFLLKQTVLGIIEAASTKSTTLLEEAYDRAVASSALSLARELAFVWCFRSSRRERAYADIATWFFRLTWLTRATADAEENLDTLIKNYRQFWARFELNPTPPIVDAIRGLVAAEPSNAGEVVDQLEAELAQTARKCGLKSFIPELRTYLNSNQCRDWVSPLVTDILHELASFVCAAETESIEAQIQDEIDLLETLFVSNPNTETPELENSKRLLDQCHLVFDFNRGTQEASEDLLAALLTIRPLLDTGIESSRSNWFFLTKSAQLATQPQLSSIPLELYGALNGQATSDFIAGMPDLDPQVAIRLRLLGAETDCRQSFVDFTHHAMVAIAKAKKARQAVGSPSQSLDASREHLDACLAHVAGLTQECRENSDWHAELEEALLLRGSNMLLVASESRRLSSEYQAWGNSLEIVGRQLLAEVRSLATARGADENDPRMAFISMFDAKDYFSVPIEETVTQSSIILLPESHQTTTPNLSNLSPAEIVAAMKSFDVVASSRVIAESHGLDNEFLPIIEFDQTQYLEFLKCRVEFCTHLIGEWDSHASNSLAEAYASRPKYVCRCDKLGKRTVVQAPDAETAFNSMVRNNCDGCPHRHPIVETDSE